MPQLVYIADPMCSWCYGFGPELAVLLAARPDARIDVLLGGLRAFNTAVMDNAMKATLREHWQHVEKASGLPFSTAVLGRNGFVYDTEPACRAIVVARSKAPGRELDYFKAVQDGFYRDGRDVTQGDVLADIAAENGLDRSAFAAAWASQAAMHATRSDFATVKQLGVHGFPTLMAIRDGQHKLIASGFARADILLQRMGRVTTPDKQAALHSAR